MELLVAMKLVVMPEAPSGNYNITTTTYLQLFYTIKQIYKKKKRKTTTKYAHNIYNICKLKSVAKFASVLLQ